MNAVIARIALRYLAGFLVAKGMLDSGIGSEMAQDPDLLSLIQVGIGVAVGVTTEAFYFLAHKFNWTR